MKGGLGNQLFIYAAARALALRTGRRLYLDIWRGYTADTYGRSYRLDRFPIQAQVMPEAWRVATMLRHLRHKLIRVQNKLLQRNHRGYLSELNYLGTKQLTSLQGLDFAKYHPRFILLEDRMENRNKHRFLLGKVYKLVNRRGVNNWYVPTKVPYPVSLLTSLKLLRTIYLSISFRQLRVFPRRLRGKG